MGWSNHQHCHTSNPLVMNNWRCEQPSSGGDWISQTPPEDNGDLSTSAIGFSSSWCELLFWQLIV
jgi:hypothetical protein